MLLATFSSNDIALSLLLATVFFGLGLRIVLGPSASTSGGPEALREALQRHPPNTPQARYLNSFVPFFLARFGKCQWTWASFWAALRTTFDSLLWLWLFPIAIPAATASPQEMAITLFEWLPLVVHFMLLTLLPATAQNLVCIAVARRLLSSKPMNDHPWGALGLLFALVSLVAVVTACLLLAQLNLSFSSFEPSHLTLLFGDPSDPVQDPATALTQLLPIVLWLSAYLVCGSWLAHILGIWAARQVAAIAPNLTRQSPAKLHRSCMYLLLTLLTVPALLAFRQSHPRCAPGFTTRNGLCTQIAEPANWVPSDMVEIPAGAFWQGADPPHHVYLSSFAIDQQLVSTARYSACVQAQKCPATASHKAQCYGPLPSESNDNLPQSPICIDTQSAQMYCRWRAGEQNSPGLRLPTEAEWEKAARGVDGRAYPWGRAPATATRLPPVTSQTPLSIGIDTTVAGASPYGLRDMVGAYFEWTLNQENLASVAEVDEIPQNTHQSPTNRYILRGGHQLSSHPPAVALTYSRVVVDADNDTSPILSAFRCVSPKPREP